MVRTLQKLNIMNLLNLIYFFLSCLLIAALPGPAMMLTIQGTLQQNWKTGLQITIGILLADTVLLLMICLGIGALLTKSPLAFIIMNIFSSIYLLYLGMISLKEAKAIQENIPNTTLKTDWKAGFFITIINPKTIVFLLAYLPQFVDTKINMNEQMQLFILSFWFLLAVAGVMLFYTFAAHAARHFLSSMKTRFIMSIMFGVILIVIGLQGFYQMI